MPCSELNDLRRDWALLAGIPAAGWSLASASWIQRGTALTGSGIMSGGAEANFELGWAVNVDSNVNLLKATHAHAKEKGTKPVYVFVSSLAVYGGPKCLPESYVVPQ